MIRYDTYDRAKGHLVPGAQVYRRQHGPYSEWYLNQLTGGEPKTNAEWEAYDEENNIRNMYYVR